MKSAIEILLGKDGWRSDGDGGAVVDTGSDTFVKLHEVGENTGIVELENPYSDWGVDEADIVRLVEAFNAIHEANGEPPLFVSPGERQGGENIEKVAEMLHSWSRETEAAPRCKLFRFREDGETLYVVAGCHDDAVEAAANEGFEAANKGDSVTIKNLGSPVIDMRLFGGAR